ncbi:MAG: phosphotransferase, partial [Pseudomonadota bacterium]
LARRCLNAGAFVTIAHPHWYNLTVEDARTLGDVHAVEVYNHTCAIHAGRGEGDYFWDALLSEGRGVTGIAVDDSHFPDGGFDGFGGWVMVKAQENNPDALLEALKVGRFYASQGPRIDDVIVDGEEIVLACSPAVRVFAVGPGALARRVEGTALRQARLPLAPFKEDWFRLIVCDAQGRRAWSNPHWPKGR